jgi:hypothetical protein
MKRDAFIAKGLRIETSIDASGRWFTCWKPDVSVYCRTRKDLLKGELALVGDANVEGSFDPLAHDVDNENTRTVI